MATVTDNLTTWKTLLNNGEPIYTIYWKDFNPISDEELWDMIYGDLTTSWETSFNLSWFQCGNEVCFCAWDFKFTWLTSATTITTDMIFQKYNWWWMNTWWTYNETFTLQPWWTTRRTYRFYVGVDYDEIWTDATRYRFLFQLYGSGINYETYKEFGVSNLSFDTTRHPSWYLRVEWGNLCFTDASRSSIRWYKHIINIDTSYSSSYVGNPWRIWLPDLNTDDHIYYTDVNGYLRRTKTSNKRYDDNDNYAGTSNAWYIWVSNSDWAEDWYAHLCYVNGAGFKRRICNGWIA